MQLAEAYRLISELSGQVGRPSARVKELERQARKDSSTSSRPPSSGGPQGRQERLLRRLDQAGPAPAGREIGIKGRSTMTKVELIKALRNY